MLGQHELNLLFFGAVCEPFFNESILKFLHKLHQVLLEFLGLLDPSNLQVVVDVVGRQLLKSQLSQEVLRQT